MPDDRYWNAYKEGYTAAMEATLRGPIKATPKKKPKRKLSAWNKYVKANSNKPRFRYARSNKINLKKMAIAFRKTPAGRKKRR
jgi:hypothetical protein